MAFLVSSFEKGYLSPDFGLHFSGELFLLFVVFAFDRRDANPNPAQ